jgi:hypothetical protein
MTGLKAVAAVLVGFGIVVSMTEVAAAAAPAPSLPPAVSQAFQARFPQGKVTEAKSEVMGGVTVYYVEFTEGSAEKEATVSAGGIVMSVGQSVSSSSVPAVVMNAIKKAAAGATIKEILRIEITHEAKNGVVTKLPTPDSEYIAELKNQGKKGEVTVRSDGTLVDPVSWE